MNEELKTLYFVFFDPRCPKDMFYLTLKRADLEDKITEYLELERSALLEIDSIIKKLLF